MDDHISVHYLGNNAIKNGGDLSSIVQDNLMHITLEYDSIYDVKSDWKLLPVIDYPYDVTKFMLSGTGPILKASAENQQKMPISCAL